MSWQFLDFPLAGDSHAISVQPKGQPKVYLYIRRNEHPVCPPSTWTLHFLAKKKANKLYYVFVLLE